MYTAIRNPDGSLILELHEAPESLSPSEAREALRRFEVVLLPLAIRAGISGRSIRRPAGRRSRRARSPEPVGE